MPTTGSLTRAIVRPPGANFADGLTAATLGAPDLALALAQHAAYCDALRDTGLDIIELLANEHFPDSTFVEDAAIITPRGAIITRPGAPSRRGEVEAIGAALAPMYSELAAIQAPGTLDGGDVCQVGGRFFIGVGRRTNVTGAEQLMSWLVGLGYSARTVELGGHAGLLHLKTGLSALGDDRVAATAALAGEPSLRDFDRIIVPEGEEYAANCLLVNERLLLPAGFPRFEAIVRGLGFHVIALDMSEFRKMDGGLSCLSIRF